MAARRIGLFGGSFDPPHVAHLAVAEAAREQARLDRVLWIPAATSPFKAGEETSEGRHRLEMVRLAIAGNPAFDTDDLEIARGGISYTVDTIEEIADRHPDAELRLIIGGDSLRTFERWREPRRIVETAALLVYRRAGDSSASGDLPDWLSARVTFVEAPAIDLSATHLRRMLAEGRSGRYLVPDAVLEYAARQGLYRLSR
jgi:nicotinate-nucleotide adenylyltransferase